MMKGRKPPRDRVMLTNAKVSGTGVGSLQSNIGGGLPYFEGYLVQKAVTLWKHIRGAGLWHSNNYLPHRLVFFHI